MTQPSQEELQYNQETAELERQLSEAIAGEEFFERASGKLIVELLTKEITNLTRKVTSNDFLKDHVGYVNAVCALQANQNLLKRLQLAAAPQRKAKILEKLDGRK
jgi:hypothetical protein